MDVRSRRFAAIQAGAVSQSKLARDVGVSVQNLHAYLKGKYKTIAVLPDLAKRLGVPLEWLTTGKGPAPSWACDTPEPRPIVIQGGGPEQIPGIGAAAASVRRRLARRAIERPAPAHVGTLFREQRGAPGRIEPAPQNEGTRGVSSGFLAFSWWPRPESNQRHADFQAVVRLSFIN